MKVKNKTTRNVSVLGQHPANGGEPFRVTFPAESELELSDADFGKVRQNVAMLEVKKVLEVTEAPESPLTIAEIIDKVFEETEIKLPKKLGKSGLQAKAAVLGVEV